MTLFFSLWKIYLNLEPTNQLNWKIWTCDIPQQNTPRYEIPFGAGKPLSVWGRLYQPVTISHGCHHGLQLEAPTSHLLQFFCISDSSNFISSSVRVCVGVYVCHTDWQIYYHWFSLFFITDFILNIPSLFTTLIVVPLVWLSQPPQETSWNISFVTAAGRNGETNTSQHFEEWLKTDKW